MRFVLYGCFFSLGVVAALIGPLIPQLRADLHLGYAVAGLVFSAQSVGSLAVLVAGGWLVHRLGTRRVVALGLALFALGLALSALAADYLFVLAGNFAIGAGMALMDIGVSTVCIDLNPTGKGKALGLLHFFFGAGAVFGPLVAWALGPLPGGWRWAFGACALLPLVVGAAMLRVRFPAPAPVAASVKFGVYRQPLLWIGGLALCVYCGVEWGVGAWFPSYWKEIPGGGAIDPAFATSLFWLTFSIGRVVQGGLADRWGFRRFLSLASLATAVDLAAWILLPAPAAVIALALGFGFVIAGIYPTVVAMVSQRFPASSGQLAPVLSVFAAIGSLVWPPAIGAAADLRGMAVLPWIQLALTALMFAGLAASFWADRRAAARG